MNDQDVGDISADDHDDNHDNDYDLEKNSSML